MNEQQITIAAIRHLAQVVEAFSASVQAEQLENVASAMHCIRFGTSHIQKIAENNQDNDNAQHRLWNIRDAMDWLLILRRHNSEIDVIAQSGLVVPTERDIQAIRTAAAMWRSDSST